ncbi:hypothetical protein LB504_002778 [Fusarium proliferatum]|nr:hypothetical protein LB504_002778 [Fusarium proliferatum]
MIQHPLRFDSRLSATLSAKSPEPAPGSSRLSAQRLLCWENSTAHQNFVSLLGPLVTSKISHPSPSLYFLSFFPYPPFLASSLLLFSRPPFIVRESRSRVDKPEAAFYSSYSLVATLIDTRLLHSSLRISTSNP